MSLKIVPWKIVISGKNNQHGLIEDGEEYSDRSLYFLQRCNSVLERYVLGVRIIL